MKYHLALLTTLLICCPCLFAQKPERQSVAINFKDTNKKPVIGTLVSLDMTQISVETDPVRKLGLKIDMSQVASITFFDIPVPAEAEMPASLPSSNTITCGPVSIKRPELRGLRLGMSIEEVKAIKPSLRTVGGANEVGEHRASIYSAERGVSRIGLEFLDGRLTYIEVAYDNTVKWKDEQQFLSRVAENFGLPTPWHGLIECQGLNLDADYNYGISPEIHLYDPSARHTVRRRRADIEEKKRREFKP